MEFQFYMPTRVITGEDCIRKNKDAFRALGTKALIVTGARSAKANGSEKDVTEALKLADIEYVVFDKVMSNPTIACVYEGAVAARKAGADFVIAIGGGSPMDAGKAIALLAAQDISEDDLFKGQYENKILPMAFVPTTAGTGSEVTPYSILTNDKAQTKTSIATPLLFPALAFLDGRYTKDLGITTTINTAIDALSHGIEGMISVKANPVSDVLAKESIRQIGECFKALKEGSLTAAHREQLLYASMLAGVVIAHTGTTAVHSMGYSLTYFKDIDHGRANGLLLAEFMKFTAAGRPDVIESIITAMGYKKLEELEKDLEELLGAKEVITAEEISKYSSIAIKAKNIGNCPVVPEEKDLIKIYTESFGLSV